MDEILENMDFEDLLNHLRCGNHTDLYKREILEAIDAYLKANNGIIDGAPVTQTTDVLDYLINIGLITVKNLRNFDTYSVIPDKDELFDFLKECNIDQRCADEYKQAINQMERRGIKISPNIIIRIIKIYQKYYEKSKMH